MEIKGRIIAVMPVKTGTTKKGEAYAMQDFVIETLEQYPKRCMFNVFGEDKLKQFNIQQGGDTSLNSTSTLVSTTADGTTMCVLGR